MSPRSNPWAWPHHQVCGKPCTQQTRAIQQAALMLGRWLPSTGSFGTVLTLLGVQP
ncbi:hypothetical protein HNQ79_006294 [Streptomyces candidus]|uniref:Uncharacterized protein n=1 Tax=Streptomyces candidus TaxID=67283 RepID=A0A7X0LT19_9ACTN|nr:hypothetical protein [Streptomyces candidus]